MSRIVAARLVEATGLSKSFDGVPALNGVCFDLEPGEVHALVGENGAGKSTLIKIITGAITADSGTLIVDGQEMVLPVPALTYARGIYAIYQQPTLFPHLTVAEN